MVTLQGESVEVSHGSHLARQQPRKYLDLILSYKATLLPSAMPGKKGILYAVHGLSSADLATGLIEKKTKNVLPVRNTVNVVAGLVLVAFQVQN